MAYPVPGKREEVAAAGETAEIHETVAAREIVGPRETTAARETVAPSETRDGREIHETMSVPSTHQARPIAPDPVSVAVAASTPAPVNPAGRDLSTSTGDLLRGSPSASPAGVAMRRHSARVVYGREQQARVVEPAGRASDSRVAPSIAAASPAVLWVDSTPPALAPERPARSVPRAARFDSRSVQVVATAPSATTHPSRSVAAAPLASTPVATEAVGAIPVTRAPVAAAAVVGTPVATTRVARTPITRASVAGLPVASTPVARAPIAAASVAAPSAVTATRHTAPANPAALTARIETLAPVASASITPAAVSSAAPAPSSPVAMKAPARAARREGVASAAPSSRRPRPWPR